MPELRAWPIFNIPLSDSVKAAPCKVIKLFNSY
jgi:hypothetical protein